MTRFYVAGDFTRDGVFVVSLSHKVQWRMVFPMIAGQGRDRRAASSRLKPVDTPDLDSGASKAQSVASKRTNISPSRPLARICACCRH
jgi:hypothetical protein